MVNPVRFEGSEAIGKPVSWDDRIDGPCHALPAHIGRRGDFRTYTSVWAFTQEERARIAAGENLAITLVGSQVPMCMSVEAIYGEEIDLSQPEPKT